MNCALCDAFDQSYRFVASNDSCFAVVCKQPLKRGHVLVIPKRHVLSLSEFSKEEAGDFLSLVEEMKCTLSKGFEEHPIVFQNSGNHATQEHLHFHVLPSKGGLRQFFSMYEGMPIRPDVSEEVMGEMRDEIKSYM